MKRLLALLLSLTACTTHPYTLTLCIDAHEHPYTSARALAQSLSQTPGATFSHAWVRIDDGDHLLFSGGHTNDYPYFEELATLILLNDPNPIRVLWHRTRGRFERGSGGHRPTHVARIPISETTYNRVCAHIAHYDFSTYTLHNHNCATLVSEVAALAGLHLVSQINLTIPGGLWTNPTYQTFTIATPDVLVAHPLFKAAKPSRRPQLGDHAA